MLLSQVMVTLRSWNCGTSGTILSGNVALAASPKLRSTLSITYVHCDATPLRSAMSASRPPKIGLNDAVGPSFGAGGAEGGGGVGSRPCPFQQPDRTTCAPCLFCNLSTACSRATRSVVYDAAVISDGRRERSGSNASCKRTERELNEY